MRFSLTAALAFSLIACAASRPKQDATATASASGKAAKPTLASNAGGPNAQGKYICEYEEDTGSHMRQKVCRYQDNGESRQGLQNELMRNTGPTLTHGQ